MTVSENEDANKKKYMKEKGGFLYSALSQSTPYIWEKICKILQRIF